MSMLAWAVGPQGFGTYRLVWGDPPSTWERAEGEPEAVVAPGYVDLHIHGAFGMDFMSASSGDLVALADRLVELRYEAWLPTTVTASAQDVAAALGRLPEHPSILGFHLEGPFLSPEFPGAQPREFMRSPLVRSPEWDAVLADPRLRVATVAPEVPGGMDLVRQFADRGVIVSLGHSNATYDEALEAASAGARHTTHTFNAMRGLHHREAGLLGAALSSDHLRCELIYDRIHVVREAVDVLRRCKGPEGVIAVSDSSAATGLPEGTALDLWGHAATVGKGRVCLQDGTLAGSAITLADAFRFIAEDFGVEAAIRWCCINPRWP